MFNKRSYKKTFRHDKEIQISQEDGKEYICAKTGVILDDSKYCYLWAKVLNGEPKTRRRLLNKMCKMVRP